MQFLSYSYNSDLTFYLQVFWGHHGSLLISLVDVEMLCEL